MPKLDPGLRRRRIIRLLIVSGLLVMLCGGLYALFLLNKEKPETITDAQVIEMAREAYAADDFDQVLHLLESPSVSGQTIAAIQQDPELLDIYITARGNRPIFGDRHLTYLVKPLQELIKLDPANLDNSHKLVNVYLDLDRHKEALALTEALTSQHPEDAVAFRQLAQAQARTGKRDKALATLYQSTEIEPLHVPTYVEIIALTQELGESAEPFIDHVQQAYDAQQNDPRAMLIRALAYETEGNDAMALDMLKRASEQAPPDKTLIPQLVQWLDQAGLYVRAGEYLEEHAETGITSAAGRLAVYRAFERGDHPAVLKRLQQSDPSQANTDLLGMWISANIHAGHKEQAQQLVEALSQRDNEVAAVWNALLTLDMKGQPTPGQQIDTLIKQIQSQDDPDLTELMRRHPFFMQRLGEAYLQALEPEAAFAALSVAASNSRSWARPHLYLTQTLLKLGQTSRALSHAKEAVRRDPSPDAQQWLVLAMSAAVDPENRLAIDRVILEADRVPDTASNDQEVLITIAELLGKSGRTDEAKKRIEDTLNIDQPRSAQQLVAFLDVSQRYSLGLDQQIKQALEAQHGATPGLTRMQAQALAKQGDVEAGRRLLEEAAPTPITKPWQTAIAAYLAAHAPAQASASLAELAEQYPADIALQLSALKMISSSEDAEIFSETIERLREHAGNATINWRLQQARAKMQGQPSQQAIKEAIDVLSPAEAYTPVHLELRLLLARCYLLAGDHQAAANRAQAAKSIAPRHPQAMLLHGKALHQLKRYQESRIDLIPLAKSAGADPNMRLQACLMLHEQGKKDVVRATIESMWAAGRTSNQALILLGRVYLVEGHYKKVDQVCSALLNAPDPQAIRFASAYYRQTNRPALAEQALRLTESAGISKADRLMIVAEDAARLGDFDSALRSAEEAANTEPKEAMRWRDAAQLALSITKPNEAIRLVAAGLAHTPDDTGMSRLAQQKELIKQIQHDPGLTPLAVAVLTSDTHHAQATAALRVVQEHGQTEQAARELAELADQHADYKHLGELACDRLLLTGLDKQAYQLAEQTMARFPDSAAAARVASLSAYRLQEWTMLLSATNAWRQRDPQARANADLMHAAATNALERHNVTIKTLAPYIRQQEKTNDGDRVLFDLYTRALVRSGNTPKAWGLLAPKLKQSQVARALAFQRIREDIGQSDRAARWLNELRQSIADDKQELFVYATASFLAGERLNDDALVKVAGQALAEVLAMPGPHGVDVHYAYGQVAQRLGNLDQAEASYHTVMKAVPENPQLLNNLALVLSDRRRGGDLQEAEALAQRATQLDPKNPNLFDTLAVVRLRRGEHDQALVAIEGAIQLDPDNPAWRLTQADILQAKGENDRAESIRQQYAPRVQF